MSDTPRGWRLVTFVWQYSGNRTDPYQAALTRRTPGAFMAELYRWAAATHHPRLPKSTPHLICWCEVSDAEAAELEAAGVAARSEPDEASIEAFEIVHGLTHRRAELEHG